MAETNGKATFTFVGSVIVGVIVIAGAANQMVYVPLVSAVTDECHKRIEADTMIKKEMGDKLDKVVDKLEIILVQNSEMKSDIKYLKASKCI